MGTWVPVSSQAPPSRTNQLAAAAAAAVPSSAPPATNGTRPATSRPGPPCVPPKPQYRNTAPLPMMPGSNLKRQTVASQDNHTGKVESRLAPIAKEETTAVTDSGLGNESSNSGSAASTSAAADRDVSPPSKTVRVTEPGDTLDREPLHHRMPTTSQPSLNSMASSPQEPSQGGRVYSSPSMQSSPSPPHLIHSQSLPAELPHSHHHRNGNLHIIIPDGESTNLSDAMLTRRRKSYFTLDQPARERLSRESLFNILSGMYALLLVVMGICFPLSEIFALNIHIGVFEGFYVYLYLTSIAFLLYVYLFLLRKKTLKCRRRRKKHAATEEEEESIPESGHEVIPLHRSVSSPCSFKVTMTSSSHTGSFYLRLGAVGFGIGAMIHEGLMFGQLFEMEFKYECINFVMVFRSIVQLTFTFVQLYFIFLNSKMCIHRYRIIARFGLMHMIATNLCVWLRVVVMETIHEIEALGYWDLGGRERHGHMTVFNKSLSANAQEAPPVMEVTVVPHLRLGREEAHGGHVPAPHDPTPSYNSLNITMSTAVTLAGRSHGAVLDSQCFKHDLISTLVKQSSPYLYPCTIEYSLIVAGILYIMWLNIGRPPPPTSPDDTSSIDAYGNLRPHHRMSVDCSGANRGLFFGIFTLVGTIISVIVFFVMVENPKHKDSAIMVVHISELVLYFLALVGVCFAMQRIGQLRFHPKRDNQLDETLLAVSMVGVYMRCIFSIVAGRFNFNLVGYLVVVSSFLVMLQATFQTIFILNGLRRSSPVHFFQSHKPGREFITFLLVCNMGMWGINTFEVLRSDSNPVALEFFGYLPWAIITHITTPLGIFYRFHSTACLAEIWKNAYKVKTH